MKFKSILVTALIAAGSTQAAVILQPTSVTASTIASGNYDAPYAGDQSGLSGTYVSGVDDFATTLSTLTHTENVGTTQTGWASGFNPNLNNDPSLSDGRITLDMGAIVSVSRIGIWMYLSGGAPTAFDSTDEFEVFSSTDGTTNALSITSLGVFNLADSSPGTGLAFDITDATSRYFVINVRSLHDVTLPNGNNHASFGEVAFEAAVPEPSAALLGGLGVLALLRRRR